MNKRNFLLSVLAVSGLMFTSCSDDDNNNNNNSGNNNPDTQEVFLFTSSNTSGKISVTDLNDATAAILSFDNSSTDADGIYYDNQEDRLIQASRTDNRLNVYGNVRTAIENSSTGLNISASSQQGDFNNPREIAVSGNKVFVVQDEAVLNGLQNKIVVYERNGATLTLHRTYNVDFKLWGIYADDEDLYAVVDNTGDIVEFDNILTSANGDIMPTKRVTIEGLTRTHGITYSDDDDTMILTDIGSATSDTDGGLIVIENFDDVFEDTVNGSIIPLSKQKRIYGAATTLGNPVDVAYDDATNMIYVAERLNSGGRVLKFSFPTAATSNMAPLSARSEAGVSAVYLSRKTN